jgi:filamin
MADGTYRISYTPFEEGTHLIDILYDGVPIPGSPFAVNVRRGCDPKKVKAFGPGLERGVVNQPNVFTIETRGMKRDSIWQSVSKEILFSD